MVYGVFRVIKSPQRLHSPDDSTLLDDARRPERGEAKTPLPPVSILKPLFGAGEGLRQNLESFFRLNYPKYEIVFCLDETDPAMVVVRELRDQYPEVLVKIANEHEHLGLNPKVNNLSRGWKKTSYNLVLISDADVMADKHYLQDTAALFEDPSVGVVTNPIRGIGKGTWGAILENLHLNFFVIGATCFLYRFIRRTCVTGKSMLLKKEDMEKVGGLAGIKDFLAEDYILGMKFQRLGKKVVLCDHLIASNNTKRSTGRFLARSLRWAQMRLRLNVWSYASEMFSNPVFWAVALVFLSSFSTISICVLVGVGLFKIALEGIQGWMIQAENGFLSYLLVPIKDILMGILWFSPFFKCSVEWGGKRYKIKAHTKLQPY
jgi:ceramide glucosyltransferase